jgi:hypothetical protein
MNQCDCVAAISHQPSAISSNDGLPNDGRKFEVPLSELMADG